MPGTCPAGRWSASAATTPDLTETVPPEDWNAALLAHVFRATFLQHELLRENLQLRGDLKTIARRVDARRPHADRLHPDASAKLMRSAPHPR